MSFDKNYPKRKDHRKPYRGSKSFDRSCRNHGTCPYCLDSRMHKHEKRMIPDIFDDIDTIN